MPANVIPTVVVDNEVPSWKSPNELLHEKINFDDTIWGFGLAGGAYYKTPLRITYVKPGSRAERAHIYPGDIVLKINGIDSKEITLEQAHEMIIDSGINLMINVTSPEDVEEGYFCYQDPLEEPTPEELRAKAKPKAPPKAPRVPGKSSLWGLQWPWKCKRKTIYKESNCYLVPSKYEETHKDTRKPEVKQDDTIVLDSIYKGKTNSTEAKETINSVTNSEKNKIDIPNDTVDDKKTKTVIEPLDTVDKHNDDSVKNQSKATSGNNEENFTENNIIDNATEQISSFENNDQYGSVDKNDDIATEHDPSENKDIEDVTTEKNSSVDENNEDVNIEQNSSVNTDNDFNNLNDIIDDKDNVKASDAVHNTEIKGENVKLENGDIPGIGDSDITTHNSR